MAKSKSPPFTITAEILSLSQQISRELGKISTPERFNAALVLRRINSIRTIQATLAIEGNMLQAEQITAIFEGKRVVGAKRDIEEAKNALAIYADLKHYNPLVIDDLLRAHSIMMSSLIDAPGKFRAGGVGIFKGDRVVHMAPPAKMVPKRLADLFLFINEDMALPWLIKACVFHYELEFIHPFSDGNGRMGRLWQHLLLMKEDPIFEYIAVETLVRKNQDEYYAALGQCDQAGDSTPFIAFSLEQILAALTQFGEESIKAVAGPKERLLFAKVKLSSWFSRKDYLNVHDKISSSTASRDLEYGVKQGMLRQQGTKNQVRYHFLNSND